MRIRNDRIKQQNKVKIPKLIGIFGILITISMSYGLNIYPGSLIKLALLGSLTFSILWMSDKHSRILSHKISVLIIASSFFIGFYSNSSTTNLFIEKNIYGSAIRNFGTLQLIFLTVIYFTARSISLNGSAFIIKCLTFAGTIQILYAFLQIFGFDFVERVYSYRVSGTLGNPNFLSAFIAVSLIPDLFGTKKSKQSSFFILLKIVFAMFVFWHSGSSQGFVLFVLALEIKLFLSIYLKRETSLVGLTGTYLLINSVLLFAIVRIETLFDYLVDSGTRRRLQLFRWGTNYVMQEPLFGHGFDSFSEYSRRSRPLGNSNFLESYDSAHNLFLDIAIAIGLLPAMFLLAFWLFSLTKAIQSRKNLAVSSTMQQLFAICTLLFVQLLINIPVLTLNFWCVVFLGLIQGQYGKKVGIENSFIVYKKLGQVTRKFIALCLLVMAWYPFLKASHSYNQFIVHKDVSSKEVIGFPVFSSDFEFYSKAFLNNSDEKKARELIDAFLEKDNSNYNAYYLFMFLNDISEAEKEVAKAKMRELDPAAFYLDSLRFNW